jgi:hypothetical protein
MSPKPNRAQLLEARDNIQRQIEILEAPPTLLWDRQSTNAGAISELRRVLTQLNESLGEPTPQQDENGEAQRQQPRAERTLGSSRLWQFHLKVMLVIMGLGVVLLVVAMLTSPLGPPRGHFNLGFGSGWKCAAQNLEPTCLLTPDH